MTSSTPADDGADLAELRDEIDALKDVPTEQLVDPQPADLLENEPTPTPTDAIGSTDWNESAE